MIMLNNTHHDPGFEVPACSREDLLRFAATVQKAIGYNREAPFPVMKFIEQILYEIYPDYLLEIVEVKDMEDKFGETFPHKHHIRLREDVYIAATEGNPYVLGKHSNPLYNRIAGQTANRPSLRTTRNRSFEDSS